MTDEPVAWLAHVMRTAHAPQRKRVIRYNSPFPLRAVRCAAAAAGESHGRGCGCIRFVRTLIDVCLFGVGSST